MVGNSSITTTSTLCILALHTALISTPINNVVAQDASDANMNINGADDGHVVSSRANIRRKRRLRRHHNVNDGWDDNEPTPTFYQQTHAHYDPDNHFNVLNDAPTSTTNNDISKSKSQSNNHRHLQAAAAVSVSCQWYPSSLQANTCTNNPTTIPSNILNNDQMRDMMFHSTHEQCCQSFFSRVEVCEMENDVEHCGLPGDDGGGGEQEQEGGQDESCVSLGWHADMATQAGCTDDDNYPEQWLEAKIKQFMFHATPEKCCSAHFKNKDCITHKSSCSEEGGTTNNNEACTTPGWYADPINKDGCSNGNTYLDEWLTSQTSRKFMFFPTSSECCNQFFNGRNCKIYNDVGCTIDPNYGSENIIPNCNDKEWHPDVKTKTGCTNDSTDYPPSWKSSNANSDQYFFASAQDCCNKYPSTSTSCQVRNACDAFADDVSTLAVTPFPSPAPTPAPTRGMVPTPPPTTKKPTSAPTPQPTSQPTLTFYVQYFSGQCVTTSDIPKPYYIDDTFTNYDDCCEMSHDRDKCIDNGPTDSPTIFVPTISPGPTTLEPTTQTLFYVEHFSGDCREGYADKIPHYSETYHSYRHCCEFSFKTEECLANGPTQPPTSGPSTIESMLPSSQPSELLSAQPSSVPSAADAPTISPTTFYWGALMAFSEKPTLRPTKADCSKSFWHAFTTENQAVGCTNYEIDPDQSPTLMYQTVEDCCASSFEGQECIISDNCELSDNAISAWLNFDQTKNQCDNYWHPDIDIGRDGCSNSRNMPSSWKKPENKVNLLFDTSDECCQKLFLDEGNHCKLHNLCTTETPTRQPTTLRPTRKPVTAQPVTPAPVGADAKSDVCATAKWHIAVGHSELACSNSFTYPEAWNDSALSGKFLFDTHEACCVRFTHGNPLSCGKINDCESMLTETSTGANPSPPDPTKKPTPRTVTRVPTNLPVQMVQAVDSSNSDIGSSNPECDGKSRRQCFNAPGCKFNRNNQVCAPNVEEAQTQPKAPPVHQNQASPESFPKTSVAGDEGCHQKWHMTIDFTKCSNNFDYPLSWLDYGSRFFFDSPADCCMGAFNYPGCTIEDICRDIEVATVADAETSSPTKEPTPATEKPVVEVPSTTQTQSKNDANPLGQCKGKAKKPCIKDPACKFDRSSFTCSQKIVLPPQPTSKSPPAPASQPRTIDASRISTTCSHHPDRKPCVKDSTCIWNNSLQTCFELATFATSEKQDITIITNTEATAAAMAASSATISSTQIKCKIETMQWHPKTIDDRTCSNSNAYPPLWDNPPYNEQYLFKSHEQCCKIFYGQSCGMEDVCDGAMA